MKRTFQIVILLVIFFGTVSMPAGFAQKETKETEALLTGYLRPSIFAITMVMVHDVVDPPAASRYYSYMMLTAYDLVAQHDPAIVPPGAFIQHYPATRIVAGGGADGHSSEGLGGSDTVYDYRIAAAYSILETGRQMLPSGYMLEDEEKKFVQRLQDQHIPQSLIDRSVAVARAATAKVIGWSRSDGYNRLSALLRYSPLKNDSSWYPTPPAYMEAVQPHWRTIRPMIIDSSDQFMPPRLTPFSMDKNSDFYRLVMEVYTISKDTGAQSLYERTIAGFWDCNPFAVTTSGHMAIGLKKISPGGHWMDIAGNAALVAHIDFDHTIEVETLVATTLMDAFIA